MAKVKVLLEVEKTAGNAAKRMPVSRTGTDAASRETSGLLNELGLGAFRAEAKSRPVPMLYAAEPLDRKSYRKRKSSPKQETRSAPRYAAPRTIPEHESQIIAGEIDESDIQTLRQREGVKVWPNSQLELAGFNPQRWLRKFCPKHGRRQPGPSPADDPSPMSTNIDCRPYTEPVETSVIQQKLGVNRVWNDGVRGEDIVVGILDTGINKSIYPAVIGGFSAGGLFDWGEGEADSHGSMCAGDILAVAPDAKIYDYPCILNPFSGGVIDMLHEVLLERLRTGTPHILSNSFGYYVGPTDRTDIWHEFNNLDHPLNRKIQSVVDDGCAMVFAAGNCGEQCADDKCTIGGTGPGNSIHGPNSLPDVITVGAVNSEHKRLGYSSQGPGGFQNEKPDLCGYSHFKEHFGMGRPGGGMIFPCDMGTSAATPIVAGVAALLLDAFPDMSPADILKTLTSTAVPVDGPGWNANTGHGVVNAGAAYDHMKNGGPLIV